MIHRRLLAVALCGALVFLVALPTGASARCAGANAQPGSASLATFRSATLCLINSKRARRDHRTLRISTKLQEAATRHSRNMVHKRFFSHDGPKGDTPTSRVRATGYLRGSSNWAVGENIGWGAYDRATPAAMVRAWMNSSSHRRALLSGKYRHLGVGVVRGAPTSGVGRAATYTTDFGRN